MILNSSHNLPKTLAVSSHVRTLPQEHLLLHIPITVGMYDQYFSCTPFRDCDLSLKSTLGGHTEPRLQELHRLNAHEDFDLVLEPKQLQFQAISSTSVQLRFTQAHKLEVDPCWVWNPVRFVCEHNCLSNRQTLHTARLMNYQYQL